MKILFVSLYDINYSRSSVIFNGLKYMKTKHSVYEVSSLSQVSLFSKLRLIHQKNRITNPDFIFICSPSGILVPIVRILTRQRIIFDCGWPLSDGITAQRKTSIFIKIKIFFIDFISIIMSNLVLVESNEQKIRLQKFYRFTSNNLYISYTGFDETRTKENEKKVIDSRVASVLKSNKPLIFFRGSFTKESGLQSWLKIISKTKYSSINFVIATNSDSVIKESHPNITIFHERLNDSIIFELYKKCVLTVGQLGVGKRLKYTLPHKFFESAFFGKPYITKIWNPLLEICKKEHLVACENLAMFENTLDKILDDPKVFLENGKGLKKVYLNKFSQEIIVENFITLVSKHFYRASRAI